VINVPLALISFAVIQRQVSETPTQAQRRLDPFGQLTSILAVTALTFGLIEGEVIGWHAPLIQETIGVALICFVAFLFIEARGHAPMLPLRLFANSTISAGLLAGAALNFVFSGLLFVLSLFFQQVRSYPPLLAGLAFLPLTLVLTINPTFTGRVCENIWWLLPLGKKMSRKNSSQIFWKAKCR
jgi:MFS transporter, DHA2 family, methylenomycin A resistance protein